jgi:hypothetical protein
MFVIVFKQHGAPNCETQIFGPFDNYLDAEDALTNGAVPCLYGQGDCAEPTEPAEFAKRHHGPSGHRFIQKLEWVNGCIL